LSDEFSQDSDVLRILTAELKLASLIELQTVYSVEDLYDMIEILEATAAIDEYNRREADSNK